MQHRVHPHVRIQAEKIRQWGKWQLGMYCVILLVLTALLLSLGYSLLIDNYIQWELVKGAVLFALLSAPLIVASVFYLILNLDAALFYLEDSAHQERLLNEGMQDNIRRLNFEIEERKKAFQAKRRAIDELRKEIAERKKTQAELEKSYHDKGKFIATLSHELRTPLNGIVGLSRRLLASELNSQQHGWANTIFSSAETLGNIFNDIIDLDKIDRQDLDIIFQSVSLQSFINDIEHFAELICQQKGLQFQLETSGDLELYLKLDPTRLRQVLWNLLNNAVKFTSQGCVLLRCRLQTAPQVMLQFEVSDTGIGIAPAEQSRIFDMYYKSSDGRRLSIVGSGIGLSVSKALVEAMHGQIHVRSELGLGSTFCVALPSELLPMPATSVMDCPELTILLVEDVPLNADVAIGLLEQRGHAVIHAETGEDALALLETEDDIDLVLLDMQLPDMSGEQIALHMRQDDRLMTIPIVILSANVRSTELQLNGLQVDGALAKPINTNNLDLMLAKLFAPSTLKLQPITTTALLQDEQELDLTTLHDYLRSLGKEAVLRSCNLFGELLPQYLTNMRTAITQQQQTALQEAAHKLKGAAASVGLLWVQHQAKKLEQEVGDWVVASGQLDELEIKTEQHLAALREFITQN